MDPWYRVQRTTSSSTSEMPEVIVALFAPFPRCTAARVVGSRSRGRVDDATHAGHVYEHAGAYQEHGSRSVAGPRSDDGSDARGVVHARGRHGHVLDALQRERGHVDVRHDEVRHAHGYVDLGPRDNA